MTQTKLDRRPSSSHARSARGDRLGMAPRLAGTASAVIYGIVLGFTNSLQMTVDSVIWAKYFGREHLGSITGVAGLRFHRTATSAPASTRPPTKPSPTVNQLPMPPRQCQVNADPFCVSR